MPLSPAAKKGLIYALLAVGFGSLIGARELPVTPSAPDVDAGTALPFILAALGTLAFIIAGIMAFWLMKDPPR
jgi:hypothetical protein